MGFLFYTKLCYTNIIMKLIGVQAKHGVFTTGRMMRRMSVAFSSDVLPYITMAPREFFRKVAQIPYKVDAPGQEIIQRPAFTLQNRTASAGDCDDKSVLLGAYLYLQQIPYRFIAGSRQKNKPLHHVWVQAYIEGEWINLDATYAWNQPGKVVGHWAKLVVIG